MITGMGVVSPLGSTLADFQESLFAGRHGIVPIDHFDTRDMAVGVYAPVRGLDAAAHFAPQELRRLDPHSVYGLVAAREAVAHAGLSGGIDPYRLAVNMCSGLGGVETALREHDVLRQSGPRKVSPMLIPKWIPNMIAGLVSIDVGARGGSVSHNAACASSAVSIGEGLRAIRHGYADAVVCGGAEAVTQRLVMSGFQSLRALSTSSDVDRASIPFDKERGGFVMGEGGAAVVLERESHALARGARIYGVVSGYGITSDASHITAPAGDGAAMARAITDSLAEADGEDGPVDDAPLHVNAHGTGTVLNDRIEAAVIERVLGEQTLVTSTKSMTGHMLGAAGVTEVIASALALASGAVPATAGTDELSEEMRVDVVRGSARRVAITRAVSLSLGFGGHNVSLVIDRAGN
ncbi:3-oxoacyl-[acyl-carrier-protein] synthase II [Clavibacter michiganensis]|uniref:beta-ketoacyl-[acyl-carrier-protein] synthase family protein n=1 Tax=Clavibacter michiganensis TaxID=28447 RepID=UPI001E1371B5|nr:beta-ketoacyl-[acyl-carrier-protein] synthase family protein [Clavibacter michiganensis]MBM7411139.1 3-oxoacyl-[acyl-carrier-protein] synthase II [Clavibacter michiganensis]